MSCSIQPRKDVTSMKKRVLISGALAVALAAALLAVGSTVCFAQDQAAGENNDDLR